MNTVRQDFRNIGDLLRKIYLFGLRLSASPWARSYLLSSIRRRIRLGSDPSDQRPTKLFTHPFDVKHGTDTSGETVYHELRSGLTADAYATGYLGCEPSVIRRAIAAIPNRQNATFIDFGCGKGRALIVASEFSFRAILGVELSPRLSAIAAANARLIADKFPERGRIDVVQGDAAALEIPTGPVVIYMYHPFERPVMERVIRNFEKAALEGSREIYIVYQRPVLGNLLDRSDVFVRRFAEMIPLDPSEMLFSEESFAAVVIWKGPKSGEPAEQTGIALKKRLRVKGLIVQLES